MGKKKIIDITQIHFTERPVMRYETLGDWFNSGEIEVYKDMSQLEKLAIGAHEMIEMRISRLQGVNEEQVTNWDTKDTNGSYDSTMYDKDERYKKAHEYAETVERKIVEQAGVEWEKYLRSLDNTTINYHLKEDKASAFKLRKKRDREFIYIEEFASRTGLTIDVIRRMIIRKEIKGAYIDHIGRQRIPVKAITAYRERKRYMKAKYISSEEAGKLLGLSQSHIKSIVFN